MLGGAYLRSGCIGGYSKKARCSRASSSSSFFTSLAMLFYFYAFLCDCTFLCDCVFLCSFLLCFYLFFAPSSFEKVSRWGMFFDMSTKSGFSRYYVEGKFGGLKET